MFRLTRRAQLITTCCRAPYRNTLSQWKQFPKNKPLSSASVVAESVASASHKPVAYWLFGCAGMVGGMVLVGGITRITRSGLSMVDWKPHGGLPPLTQEEWKAEFKKYQVFPEFQQRSHMTLDEFKSIYWWEYGHRMLGRSLGVAFTVPMAYFALTKRIPSRIAKRLLGIFTLGAVQGGVGWWMVKSGLSKPVDEKKEIRVSPYRLATHLGLAFASFALCLWTGFDLLTPKARITMVRDMIDPTVLKKCMSIRQLVHRTAALMGITIVSGAFVAGNDAGRAYNTFPKMGDRWIPEEIFALQPFYRNFFEDTATVQLDHRILAMSTFAGFATVYGMARRGHVWKQLPPNTRTALNTTMGIAALQVSLGISALLTHVPTDLAVMHQSGSLALFTSTLWTMHTLRFAKKVVAA